MITFQQYVRCGTESVFTGFYRVKTHQQIYRRSTRGTGIPRPFVSAVGGIAHGFPPAQYRCIIAMREVSHRCNAGCPGYLVLSGFNRDGCWVNINRRRIPDRGFA